MHSHLLWSLTFSSPSPSHNTSGRVRLQPLNLSLSPHAVVCFPLGTTSKCRPRMCLVWDRSARRSPMSLNQVRTAVSVCKDKLWGVPLTSGRPSVRSSRRKTSWRLHRHARCSNMKPSPAAEADYQMHAALCASWAAFMLGIRRTH